MGQMLSNASDSLTDRWDYRAVRFWALSLRKMDSGLVVVRGFVPILLVDLRQIGT
jgi:hypothetical protein